MRQLIYSLCALAFLVASALTLSSIIIPRWISWDSETPTGGHIHYTYGLHRRCSSLTQSCVDFPQYEDCLAEDRNFCSMWRSVGWLMSFSIVMEGMTLVAYIVVLSGGRQKRVFGWKVLSILMTLIAVIECVAMAVMAYLFEHDERFFAGWRLDTSWVLCTVSWSILVVTAASLIASRWLLPSEGGYELIPNAPPQEE